MTSQTYPNFSFEIEHFAADSKARIGKIHTPHGDIETPNFVFCGTKASVKTMTPDQIRAEGTQIILSNTYHLMLQPGSEIIEKMGGLHKFMKWDGPILTDSGGYQIFAMGHGSVSEEIKGNRPGYNKQSILKITEDGATFRSYINGEIIHLTPERSMEIQRRLAPDIVLQLDECTPFHVDKTYTAKSMEMSHRWGDRSLAEFKRHSDETQAMYGIIQGGVYEDLRDISCNYVNDRDFFGIAVGGSLGENTEQMDEVVGMCMDRVRKDRPVHLLGIGHFRDIFEGVKKGIDTFDCVSPTRMARHGMAQMKGAEKERVNLLNARFREDPKPIDETCGCYACRKGFSRAYIHHLFKAKETLGPELVTQHNVHTMNRLMCEIRKAIQDGTLDSCQQDWLGY